MGRCHAAPCRFLAPPTNFLKKVGSKNLMGDEEDVCGWIKKLN